MYFLKSLPLGERFCFVWLYANPNLQCWGRRFTTILGPWLCWTFRKKTCWSDWSATSTSTSTRHMALLLTFDRCLEQIHSWPPHGYSVHLLLVLQHCMITMEFHSTFEIGIWRLEGNPWNPIQLENPVLTGSSCYWWCEAASLTCGWSWHGNSSTSHLVKTTNLNILEYDTLCQHFSRQFSPLVVPKKCADPTCDLHIKVKRWQLSKWWNCSGGDSSAQSFCRSGFFRQLFWRTDGWAGKRRGCETKTAQDLPAWRMPRCHWSGRSVDGQWLGLIGSRQHNMASLLFRFHIRARILQGQLVLTSRVIPRSTESRLGQLYIYEYLWP